MHADAKLDIKARLGTTDYRTDHHYEHITIDTALCADCPHHICTFACPAQCFELIGGELVFRYEDCVECGTCDLVCDRGAVRWTSPHGGFGVRYRYG